MPETIERECVGITEQTLDALCPRIGQRIEHPVIRKNTVTLPALKSVLMAQAAQDERSDHLHLWWPSVPMGMQWDRQGERRMPKYPVPMTSGGALYWHVIPSRVGDIAGDSLSEG